MLGKLEYVHKELFEKGSYTEAAVQFEKLIAESENCADNPLVRYNLAQCYITQEQWLKALV